MSKEREMLERVSKLRKLRDIQGKKGNHDYDEYMRGLYNGLELSLSLFEGEREPQYKNPLAQPEPPMTGREMYQRGYAAAERELKREPLSDEEMQTSSYFICCANQSTKLPEHFKVPYSIYVYVKQLEYQIEKSHGIGTVEWPR